MTTSGEDSIGSPPAVVAQRLSRYETQKRRDWQAFTKYLSTHLQSLPLRRCSGEHVLGFLRYLDRFGKTRVHAPPCPAYGGGARAQQPGAACQCPMRQAWGSLDALVGRLRAAYDEHHGRGGGGDDGAAASVDNPFAAPAVRLYLRDVREAQSVARGISYNKKRKRSSKQGGGGSSSSVGGGGASVSSKDGGSSVDDAVQQPSRNRVNQSALIVQRCARTRMNASALIVQRCARTRVNDSALMPPAPGGSGDPAAGC